MAKKNIYDIMKISFQYRKPLIYVILLLVSFSFFQLISPYMMKYFFDEGINDKNMSVILLVAFLLFIFKLFEGLFGTLLDVKLTKLGTLVLLDLREKYIKLMLVQNMDFFSRNNSGKLLHILHTQMLSLFRAITNFTMHLIVKLFLSVGIFTICFVISYQLSIIILLLIALYYYLLRKSTVKIKELNEIIFNKLSTIADYLNEIIQGIYTIKLFKLYDYVIKKHRQKTEEFNEITVRNTLVSTIYSETNKIIKNIGPLVVLCAGGYMYIQSKLTIGQLLSYYTYVAMLFALINDIAGMINSIQASLVTLEELEEFENNNQIIYNSNLLSNSEVKDVKFENISLNQVSFAYQNKVILKKINFSFKKNEHIAIVGASGVGKSTLVNIIINILKAQKGDIFLNNINYKNYTENDIMALFSVVNQNTFLFDTTIMENIYFEIGKEKKDIDTRLSFLRYINLKKDIYDLLNENVGANGGKLSGGQRQLISIARALNKDSNILILDEATSNLDSLTESYIQNILKEILDNEEKTIIVIGHRLSTLKSVDRIIVLKDGVIIEEGTWHSLKHNGTEFYRLFSDQIIKEEA